MVYCPQCGTSNKPSSKFCKNCAALLAPSTDVRCPICGTMNPSGAASCSGCGTRLTTGSASPTDKATPADTPENITPFTPPELPPAEDGEAGAPPSSSARLSFSRSSSDWTRRLSKTAPPAAAVAVTATPATSPTNAAEVTPAAQAVDDTPAWLRELETPKSQEPSKPVETESSAAAAAASAAFLANAKTKEQVPPSKPQLGEIKLTGDDYDYSDVAGEVTPEMHAALEASAAKVDSVDDEVALARQLLGLDVQESAPTAQESVDEAKAAMGAAAAVGVAAQLADESAAAAPVAEWSSATTEESQPIATAPNAVAETIAPESRSEVAETLAVAESDDASKAALEVGIVGGAVAAESRVSDKPQLGEIKLTGDDYDYSDVAGEVTDDMRAQLEANAGSVESVEDEVALARRLLGLEVAAAAVSTPANEIPAADVPVSQASVAENTQEIDENPNWVAALAAASSAALAATAVSEAHEEEAAQEATEPIAVAGAISGSAPEVQAESAGELPVVDLSATTDATDAEADTREGHLGEIAAAAVLGAAAVGLARDDTPKESSPPAALETGEMPDWLRDIAPQEFAESSAAETAGTTETGAKIEAADTEEIPAWVKGLAPAAGVVGAAAVASQLPELNEEEREDLPDWLREPIEADATPAAVDAAAAVATASEDAGEPSLELPAWFVEGKAPDATVRDPFEVVETTGPLAGVSGILPLALAITEPHHLSSPTPARSDGGRIFQTLLVEPLASSTQTETADKTRSLFNVNHLLYLIIFLAALVPLFFGLDQAGLGLDAARSATAGFYDQLQALPPNSTVLLAFDYLPGAGVELNPAAQAIVNDVIARNADVVAISSNPNGAAIAEGILQQAKEAHPAFTYVNVGYIPGNEAGLRLLAGGWLPASRPDVNGVPWGETPLAGRVSSMNDLALTVVLAADDATLRAWMEQVEPRITSPIVAATSAMLEPQARNYVNANQLQASLRGLTGAAELELLSNTTGQAVKTMDAFSVVSIVLAGIILAANVVFLIRRNRKNV